MPDSLEAPFPMPISTVRRPLYRKYRMLEFELNGHPHRLLVYLSLDLLQPAGYRDYLFVPFTDRTNGHGSYGGGRYRNLRRGPGLGGPMVLGFNRAAQPLLCLQPRLPLPRASG